MAEDGAAVDDRRFVAAIDGDEEEIHVTDGLMKDMARSGGGSGVDIGDELIGAVATVTVMEIVCGAATRKKAIHIKEVRIPAGVAFAEIVFLDFDDVLER